MRDQENIVDEAKSYILSQWPAMSSGQRVTVHCREVKLNLLD